MPNELGRTPEKGFSDTEICVWTFRKEVPEAQLDLGLIRLGIV